jgi:hypothetical protein
MRTIKDVQWVDELRVLAWGQKGDLSHIQGAPGIEPAAAIRRLPPWQCPQVPDRHVVYVNKSREINTMLHVNAYLITISKCAAASIMASYFYISSGEYPPRHCFLCFTQRLPHAARPSTCHPRWLKHTLRQEESGPLGAGSVLQCIHSAAASGPAPAIEAGGHADRARHAAARAWQ